MPQQIHKRHARVRLARSQRIAAARDDHDAAQPDDEPRTRPRVRSALASNALLPEPDSRSAETTDVC